MRLALRAANLAAVIGLCGCAFSPPLPNDTVFEPKIMRAVLTELYCAVKYLRQQNPMDPREPLPNSKDSEIYNAHFFPFDEYWIAAVDMQLKTDFQASASPELTLIGPINSVSRLLTGRTPGSYNLAAGGTYDSTATTSRDDKAYIDINLLMQHWAPPTWEEARKNELPKSEKKYILSEPVDCQHPNEGTYLDGTLGIKPWLGRAVQATQFARFIAPDASEFNTGAGGTAPFKPKIKLDINRVEPATPAPWSIPIPLDPPPPDANNPKSQSGNVPVLAATFTFIIKGSAHLGPSFTLDRVKGGSSTLLSTMRTETNDVMISMTPSRFEPTLVTRRTAKGLLGEVITVPTRALSLANALNRLDEALLKMQLNSINR
jgi:hypothetical protein